MTLLQLVQSVCRRVGITTSPNAAFTSTDPQILQLLEIANEEGQEQANRYPWQKLQRIATFTTVAAEVQGAMSTIAPGYSYIINNTIWNRDLRRPVYGPDTPQNWEQQKAIQIAGPFNRFRIIADVLNFYPVPAAGQTCVFEYIDRRWVSTASTPSEVFTNDGDSTFLDDRLMMLGMVWRWKAAKGLSYAEDFNKYETALADASNRDAGKATISMSGAMYDVVPLVVVPSGSWTP